MKLSAGILLYRFREQGIEFLLVHPGGPFWKNKDLAAWSIPKGEFTEGEAPLAAALREFEEETGRVLKGDFITLPPVKQNASKTIHAFALEADLDAASIKSNYIDIEWPPRSGKMISIPEVDKAGWFTEPQAREKIVKGQVEIIDVLLQALP